MTTDSIDQLALDFSKGTKWHDYDTDREYRRHLDEYHTDGTPKNLVDAAIISRIKSEIANRRAERLLSQYEHVTGQPHQDILQSRLAKFRSYQNIPFDSVGKKRDKNMKPQYLYTYLPKDNTADINGILSTALAPTGWQKYKERTGCDTKEEVLKVLDSWQPGFKRSYGISAFREPIPDTADDRFVEFANNKDLYRFDAAKFLAAGILTQLQSANTRGRGTHRVAMVSKNSIDWGKKTPGKFLFSKVPHYIVETKDGYIPAEYIEHITRNNYAV